MFLSQGLLPTSRTSDEKARRNHGICEYRQDRGRVKSKSPKALDRPGRIRTNEVYLTCIQSAARRSDGRGFRLSLGDVQPDGHAYASESIFWRLSSSYVGRKASRLVLSTWKHDSVYSFI